jgi:CBS domain containing-hemolysin-like protein
MLIGYSPQEKLKVRDFPLRPLPLVNENLEPFQLLAYFKQEKGHMVAVERDGQLIGILTLEDLLQELLGEVAFLYIHE